MLLFFLACGPAPPASSVPLTPVDTAMPVDPEPPPNVLVIVVDDLGKDHMPYFGGVGPGTPVFDGLAGRGLVFDRAYATPMCSSTRAALLTGLQNRRTGVGAALSLMGDTPGLSRDVETAPRMLTRAVDVWDTSLVGKWHLVGGTDLNPDSHPLDVGFDWAAGSLSNIDDPPPGFEGDFPRYDNWFKTTNGVTERVQTYATIDTTDDALARIAGSSEPFFVYVAYNAPHAPAHFPPSPLYDGPTDGPRITRYHAMIEALDQELGRLIEGIAPDLLARTNVLLVSDDGAPRWIFDPPESPARTKGTLYEPGINVPFVAFGPDIPVGRTDALVSVFDVFPTIAEWAGVDVDVDGVSLVPLLDDPDASIRDQILLERFEEVAPDEEVRSALVTRDYKLIRYPDREELYRYDLGEQDDLVADPSLEPLLNSLRARMDAAIAPLE